MAPWKSPRPNYFLAVQLAHDPRVQSVIRAAQEHMVARDARLKDVLVDAESAHLTLFVLSLRSDQLQAARDALASFPPSPAFALDLHGLSAFRTDVVYLDVLAGTTRDTLVGLSNSLRAHIVAQPALSNGTLMDDRPMTPHCTIAKMAKLKAWGAARRKAGKGRGRQGNQEPSGTAEDPGLLAGSAGQKESEEQAQGAGSLTGIEPETYADFTYRRYREEGAEGDGDGGKGSWISGVQIRSIQLLSMEGRRAGEYYPIEAEAPLTDLDCA